MKSLRKSLHRDTHRLQISTPLPISKPHPTTSLPPKKVIRALAPHDPNTPQELSFQKGDFFYVTGDPGTTHYEAYNPVTGARGLVPKTHFEELKGSSM